MPRGKLERSLNCQRRSQASRLVRCSMSLGQSVGEEEGVAVLGEGAYECILKEAIGEASVKEIGFKLDGVAEEFGTVGADPA